MDSWGSGRHPKIRPQAHFFEVFCVVFKLATIPHFHSLIIAVLILKQCFVLRSSCEMALTRRPVYPEVSCTPQHTPTHVPASPALRFHEGDQRPLGVRPGTSQPLGWSSKLAYSSPSLHRASSAHLGSALLYKGSGSGSQEPGAALALGI